ncbi:MAG: diguanylate cyclase domain-containing protein [Acidobacteriota bacterium]
MKLSTLNRTARIYVGAVSVIGSILLLYCAFVSLFSPTWTWMILAAASGIASLFHVHYRDKHGSSNNSMTDVFLFLAMLFYGPYVAVVVSVFDVKQSRYLYKVIFNLSQFAITAFVSSWLFYWTIQGGNYPLDDTVTLGRLLLSILPTAFTYYLVNTFLISLAIGLSTRTRIVGVWKQHFLWMMVSTTSGASVAALVFAYWPSGNYSAIGLAVPIIFANYFNFRFYSQKISQAQSHVSEISQLYHSTIGSLAMAIDAKDGCTHGHVRRVQVFALGLAGLAGIEEEEQLEAIKAASLLHDIGKLAIPEYILNKPSALTPQEFEKMKMHPQIGADILETVKFPYPVVPIVRHHHEKWDGTGYPAGLCAEAIPIGARILSIVDCFDALRSDRPYRPAMTHEVASNFLRDGMSKAYDPYLVDLFLDNLQQLEKEAESVRQQFPEEAVYRSIGASMMAESELSKKKLEATMFHDLASTHREIQAIQDLSHTIGKSLSVTETLTIISSKIRNIVPYSSIAFYMAANDSDLIPAYYVFGKNAEELEQLRMRIGEGVSGWVVANNKPLVNVSPAPDFLEHKGLLPAFRSCLSAPLAVDGQVVGALTLYSEYANSYSDEHLQMMETIARHAALAIRNAIVFEETKADLYTDELTGLPNANYLDLFLEQELRRAEKSAYPVTAVVLDLEGMREVNDQHGPRVGDRLLIEVAHILRNLTRSADTCARYTGDNFVLVLPGTDRIRAQELANAIQQSVDRHDLRVEGQLPVHIGISVGVATYPDDTRDPSAMLSIADQAMYLNKLKRTNKSIRNRPPKVLPLSRPSQSVGVQEVISGRNARKS